MVLDEWSWLEALHGVVDEAQSALFIHAIQPLVLAVGQGGFLVEAYNGTLWLIAGLVQVALLVLVLGPLQRWRPVQPVADPANIRVDIIYTLVYRLGLFKLFFFFALDPWVHQMLGALRLLGIPSVEIDQLVPGLTDQAWASFLIYLVVLDAVHYLVHRAQHHFSAWWALHALHHSQRDLSMWSDNRNHLLDSVLEGLVLAVVAYLIGVPAGQFVLLVSLSQLFESLQHANVRLSFGYVGERLLISPRFHRLHHSIGLGHESAGKSTLGGHNFGVLFPWWDMLLGTACFDDRYDPTGIRDQIEEGRDYGQGFWDQQWRGLLRLVGRG